MRKQRSTAPGCEHNCDGCEKAYRRGVHQAYAMLRQFLEEKGGDPLTVLKRFEAQARAIRASRKAHPHLLHEIQSTIKSKVTP